MTEIKEIKELLHSIEILAVAGAKVAKDSKIRVDDLMVLIGLMKQIGDIQDGFKGLDGLSLELKELSSDEIQEIVGQVFGILNSVKEVLK